MYSEARKLHLIEEVLRVDNEDTLNALEDLLKKTKKSKVKENKSTFRDFAGIWTKEEADEIERIIEESCETIHPDDWK